MVDLMHGHWQDILWNMLIQCRHCVMSRQTCGHCGRYILPSMWALWRVSNGCDVCCKLCGHYVLSNVWTLCRLCWHCVWSSMWTLCRAQMVVIWSRWHFPHLVAHWLTATALPPWISNWINPTHDAQTFSRVYTLGLPPPIFAHASRHNLCEQIPHTMLNTFAQFQRYVLECTNM